MSTSVSSTSADDVLRARPAPAVFRFPVVGNLPEIAHRGMLEFLQREWRKHGDVFRLRLGPRNVLVVAHPDGVERVLGSGRENYVKGSTYDAVRLLTGAGLLTMEGDAWRARRRLENPAFHRESIKKFVSTMAQVTREAIAAWRWRLPNGGVFDAHHEMMRLTLEVVAATLFGQRLGEDTGDSSGRAFGEALGLVSERGNAPVQIPLRIPTPANLRFRRALRTLDDAVYDVIKKARAAGPEAAPTLLGMLLQSRDADTGAGLTDQELRNEVLTLFLAGHETTALLMTWGFTLLARQPAVVARMRDEVSAVLGDREPTAEDVPKLVYVRQVVDEILRLRPPAWVTARDAVKPDAIRGIRVEEGDMVMAAIYLTHRHPDFWEHPERFDPDRFAPEKAKGRHHWAYLPFSLGPRICIGNVFSLTEAVVLFSMLLQRIEFSMLDPDAVRMEPTVTLRPAGAVPLRIRWRS